MYAIKLNFQGRSFFFRKGQDFLPGIDKARLFPSRKAAAGLALSKFPQARVVPVETRPALYRIRWGDTSTYLAGSSPERSFFQVGKAGSLTFTREDALALAKNYSHAVIVPAV